MALNNSLHIDSNTDVKKQKHDNDTKTKFLDTFEESTDKYRWYLCTESTSAQWNCEHKTANQALHPHTPAIPTVKNTTAIPIYKFIPQVFDNMILTHNIRSITNVVIPQPPPPSNGD